MPKIKNEAGDVVDETDNPVALAYYRREEQYTVVEERKSSRTARAKAEEAKGADAAS